MSFLSPHQRRFPWPDINTRYPDPFSFHSSFLCFALLKVFITILSLTSLFFFLKCFCLCGRESESAVSLVCCCIPEASPGAWHSELRKYGSNQLLKSLHLTQCLVQSWTFCTKDPSEKKNKIKKPTSQSKGEKTIITLFAVTF